MASARWAVAPGGAGRDVRGCDGDVLVDGGRDAERPERDGGAAGRDVDCGVLTDGLLTFSVAFDEQPQSANAITTATARAAVTVPLSQYGTWGLARG